jgi:uncharacterized membrane protein YdjX (TVP38/TMEM64 family)
VTFLACRAATGDGAMGDDRGRILGLMEGIRANAFAYILTVRLIPLVPLVPVNIAAGLARVPTRTFMLASFLGMAPCTVLYASGGSTRCSRRADSPTCAWCCRRASCCRSPRSR